MLRYSRAPRLRLRPVPEWESCLVLAPDDATLHELNLAAWLILALCDDRTEAQIAPLYQGSVGHLRPDARADVRAELDRLLDTGLIVAVPEGHGAAQETPRP